MHGPALSLSLSLSLIQSYMIELKSKGKGLQIKPTHPRDDTAFALIFTATYHFCATTTTSLSPSFN